MPRQPSDENVIDADYRDPTPTGSGLKLNDVLYILWRHKGKIVFFSLLGLAAAAYQFFTWIPSYESSAKVLVKYVVDTGAETIPGNSTIRPLDTRSESIMKAEIEILTSQDLIADVIRAVGPSRILGPDSENTNSLAAAAKQVFRSFKVGMPSSSVISVGYAHSDPALAQTFLEEVIRTYQRRHWEFHNAGLSFEMLAQRKDQAHHDLKTLEAKLNDLKQTNEITTLVETKAAITTRLNSLEASRDDAEREVEAQRARIRQLEQDLAVAPVDTEAAAAPETPPSVVEEYRGLAQRLQYKLDEEAVLLHVWTAESELVRSIQRQIQDLRTQKSGLEKTYPRLAGVVRPADGPGERRDLTTERALIAALDAGLAKLTTQIEEQRQKLNRIARVEGEIADLERRRSVLETNVYYFDRRLAQTQVDQSLDETKTPNIQVIQHPSTPVRASRREALMKPMGVSVFAGVALGLGLAFLIEMVLDQRIRKPSEAEVRLGVPLLLTVPKIKGLGKFELSKPKALPGPEKKPPSSPVPILPSLFEATENAERRMQNAQLTPQGAPSSELRAPNSGTVSPLSDLAPWHTQHLLRPYFEALRDRLVLYFQLNQMRHKPKLVAVTGCAEGAGTTTLAAGLAAALSETGDGSVLLVDMNLGKGAVHPFFRGRPNAQLTHVLEPNGREEGQVRQNLFVASIAGDAANSSNPVPARLHTLMPKMRASDYDYIIFDMPPISETSATVALAASMDQVLLVIEGDKSLRPEVKRAHQLLTRYGAKVTGIFNKHSEKAPQWLLNEA